MADLPPEFGHEPVMALAAGEDGLDIVRRIMDESKEHLNDQAGMLCELGRCGPALREQRLRAYFGRTTVSMTWMIPLRAQPLVAITVDVLTLSVWVPAV